MPEILSSQLNGLWMRFAVLYLVSACDIKKNSFNTSSKWLHLSCSCGGQPAGERWHQLLSVALSVSYDNQTERLVSLQTARNAQQEPSNRTVWVTNSEFNGTSVTAQLDVVIDLSSKTGLMVFQCSFVAIDAYHKHQYQIKSWQFQVPAGSKTTVTLQSSSTKASVGDTTTAPPSTTITSAATRTPFKPTILTRLRSEKTTAYQETSTAKATSLTRSTNEATPTTEKPTSRETRRSSTGLLTSEERTGASESLNGVNNYFILAAALAALVILAVVILVFYVCLMVRWRTKPVADPPLPQPHIPSPTGTFPQELINKINYILSSGASSPSVLDALEKRDSHVYETPYDVPNDEDLEHTNGTLIAENSSIKHARFVHPLSVEENCDETLHTVSSGRPSADAALYLTPVLADKRREDLSAKGPSSYITPTPE